MITAVDARELQKVGISQDEHLSSALMRAQEAIIDTARKGKGAVTLSVFYLNEKSLGVLQSSLKERGFVCTNPKWNEKASQLDISWSLKQ